MQRLRSPTRRHILYKRKACTYCIVHQMTDVRLQVRQDKLQCRQFQEYGLSADLASLPNNAVVFQQRPAHVPQKILYALSYPGTSVICLAAGASFGQTLQEAHCQQAGLPQSNCSLTGGLACYILPVVPPNPPPPHPHKPQRLNGISLSDDAQLYAWRVTVSYVCLHVYCRATVQCRAR